MNQTSPVTTGATAITGAMLGGCIVWACQALKIAAPSAEVAGTMGALALMCAHYIGNLVSARTAPKQ